ncbi:MAG: class I SAM-dependent methyltransferase [Burkholderiales bacterium]|nr:class I SAM-dependent methyltransferase [Flavobacterium sp.]
MQCKICSKATEKIFEKTLLQRYNTGFYKCPNCSFMQTEEPIWLEEAYQSAITSLDIGLLGRNIYLTKEISLLIESCFPNAKTMVDYAGGYGFLTRLLRDAGFNYYSQDDYCENIFAKDFDVKPAPVQKFDLVTGFEVLEHFSNPLQDLEKVFQYADDAIFSTELIPETNAKIENWWYLTEETGQHIAFYSPKAMAIIAEKFNKFYYCRNKNLHFFSSKKLQTAQANFAFKNINKKKFLFGFKKKRIKYSSDKKPLLSSDYQYIKNLLNSK